MLCSLLQNLLAVLLIEYGVKEQFCTFNDFMPPRAQRKKAGKESKAVPDLSRSFMSLVSALNLDKVATHGGLD